MSVRTIHEDFLDIGMHYYVFAGLSTDDKPESDGICTGSEFREVDSGKLYYYDEDGDEGSKWVDQSGS